MIDCIIAFLSKKVYNIVRKFNKLFKFKNKAVLWMKFTNSQQPADDIEHLESSEFVSGY